jgi:hypothetical protein
MMESQEQKCPVCDTPLNEKRTERDCPNGYCPRFYGGDLEPERRIENG